MTQPGKNQAGDSRLYWALDNVIADEFPDPAATLPSPDGLLALGGDLSPERLLDAYRRGIFPWYMQRDPILWWSPDPRCVLEPERIKISRSLAKTLKRKKFEVSFNRAFSAVIAGCAAPRVRGESTWITPDMAAAYIRLHELGYGVSVECWRDNALVGGLYGLSMGRIFFGESMFSLQPDASKVALVHLAETLVKRNFRLIDCQLPSRHLQNLGAELMPRARFLDILRHYCSDSSFPRTRESGKTGGGLHSGE